MAENVAIILQEHVSLKKSERSDLVVAVAIIWAIFCFVARTTGLKSQVLKVLMFSYCTLHQEKERSFRKLHRIKGSDKLGRQAVNLDQSQLCLYRKTTAEEFKCNRGQTTFSWWLVHTWVWLVGSHLPKQTAPSGENNLRLGLITLNERWKTGTASYVS